MKIYLDCLFAYLYSIGFFGRYCFIRFLSCIDSLIFFTIAATNDYYFVKQNDYHHNNRYLALLLLKELLSKDWEECCFTVN